MRMTSVILRGECLILHDAEVLYRSRDRARCAAMFPALHRAWERGSVERQNGWPFRAPARSPIFSLEPWPYPKGWVVVERHPRLSCLDRRLYATPSRVDADMALSSVRRAATIGARGTMSNPSP